MTEVANKGKSPAVRPVAAFFFVRTLLPSAPAGPRKPQGALVGRFPPLQARQSQAERRDRAHQNSWAYPPAIARHVPASDTRGRSEMACGRCWARVPVDLFAWKAFGRRVTDTVKQLKIGRPHLQSAVWPDCPTR